MAFNAFVNEFTAAPLQTSYPSYLEIDYTDTIDVTLEWSFQNQNTLYPFSNVIQLINTEDDSDDQLILPDASVTSAGTTTVIINTGGGDVEIVKNDSEEAIVTISPGDQWQLTLTDNSTQDGIWIALQLGSTTSSVIASSLIDPTVDTNSHSNAGGLFSFGNYLKQNIQVNVFSSGATYTQSTGDRGSLLVWTAGTGTYQCLSAETLGDGFPFVIQNNSTGALITVEPDATVGQTINGSVDPFILSTGESSLFVSDGVNTIYSYGSSQISNITTTLIDVNLTTEVSNVIDLDDIQASTSIQKYINTVGGGPYPTITINYPINRTSEYIVYNASTTNSIIVQILGETNPLYQSIVDPLKTALFFTDGTHLYSAPQKIFDSLVRLDNGAEETPSLSFTSDTTTGLFRPTSGTYNDQLCLTQNGVSVACFANSAVASVNIFNNVNTIGGSYFDESISIYTIMRAYG